MAEQPFQHVNFDKADEVRSGENWTMEIIHLTGGGSVGRVTVQPGWRWTKDIQPVAGTSLCMAPHQQYQISGHIRLQLEDGTQVEGGPGDLMTIPPGHDAWVVGDEPVVAIDWQGAAVFARRD